jgi:hypothetical protein
MAKAKNDPIQLSGNVYCDWNSFSFINPKPDKLQVGDLVIWTWSGDSETPKSSKDEGRFAVSVFDGKKRRHFKVRNTRVNGLLSYKSDKQREENLVALVRELHVLKGNSVIWRERGFQISVQAPAAS